MDYVKEIISSFVEKNKDRIKVSEFVSLLVSLFFSMKMLLSKISELRAASDQDDIATELFSGFIQENKERFHALHAASPSMVEFLIDIVMAEKSFELPVDRMEQVSQYFINHISGIIGKFTEEDSFDLSSYLSTFEMMIDLFIKEWLLPQIDKELGI